MLCGGRSDLGQSMQFACHGCSQYQGLQHLLINVVVFLDLNFQTTIEFAPERELADVAQGTDRQ